MYNRVLLPLLEDDPRKTITFVGVTVRKIVYPLLKIIIPMTLKRKLVLLTPRQKPKRPTIFISTHEFREDIEAAFYAAGVPLYIVNGSVKVIMNSFDGILNWIGGMILFDRANKKSRKAVKEKMVYALEKGANILLYPEGTWNKSPNQIISGLFPGVYEVAKRSGAQIIPIANHREKTIIYSEVGIPFDISKMECEEAMEKVKEQLATLRYDLIEKCGTLQREKLPKGRKLDLFWKKHIYALMAEVSYYDYELEKHTKYREKNVTFPDEVYDFFRKIEPSYDTAFLFRGNERWWKDG